MAYEDVFDVLQPVMLEMEIKLLDTRIMHNTTAVGI
jgi:hypothetical protein